MIGLPRPPNSTLKYSVLVTVDPAGSKPCGIAGRVLATCQSAAAETLRPPEFQYAGSVYEPAMHDDLVQFVAKNTGEGQQALLVFEDSIFGSHTISRSIGKAIGVIEGLLHYTGHADPTKSRYVRPRAFRKAMFPEAESLGREGWKEAAIQYARDRHEIVCDDNLAEAIVMNDYIILHRRKDVWGGKRRGGK